MNRIRTEYGRRSSASWKRIGRVLTLGALGAALWLSGCTKEEPEKPLHGMARLQPTVTIDNGSATKAPFLSNSFPASAAGSKYFIGLNILHGSVAPEGLQNVQAELTCKTNSANKWRYRLAAPDSEWKDVLTVAYGTYNVSGYYPYDAASDGTTISFDLSNPEETKNQTDVLWSRSLPVTISSDNNSVNFNLTHAYALLEFHLKTSPGESATFTRVEVLNKTGKSWIVNKGKIGMTTGKLTSQTAGTVAADFEANLTENTVSIVRVMVPPFTGTYADDDIEIQFKEKDGKHAPQKFLIKKTYLSDEGGGTYGFKQAMKYAYKLIYNPQGEGTLTLEKWDEGGAGGSVGGGNGSVNVRISPWDTYDLPDDDMGTKVLHYTDGGMPLFGVYGERLPAKIYIDAMPGIDRNTGVGAGTGTGIDGSVCPAGWRLPTISELRLLWAYLPALDNKFAPTSSGVWSSTPGSFSSLTQRWQMQGTGSVQKYGLKEYSRYIRCVKEVYMSGKTVYPYFEGIGIIVSRDATGGVKQAALHPYWTQTPPHNNSDPWNAVGARMAVAQKDAMHPQTGAATMNWYMASGASHAELNPETKRACPAPWRLPTQREMNLIWIFKDRLSLSDSFYWVSTEYSESSAWASNFGNDVMDIVNKNASGARVRCVRDQLTPGPQYPYLLADGSTIVTRDVFGQAEQVEDVRFHDPWPNDTPEHTYLSEKNAVGVRFEVAAKNATRPGSTAATMNWYMASGILDTDHNPNTGKACTPPWRLPTQQEMLLMHRWKQRPGAALSTGSYWTSTESENDRSKVWHVNTYSENGFTGASFTKDEKLFVRCVKDL